MATINPGDLESAIAGILSEYGDIIFLATEEALAAGEKVLIEKLREASPADSGKYKKGWKGSGKKYKLLRIVGNSTTVKSKKGDIPLSNILEYSTTRGKPFIKKTFNDNINEIANAMIDEIKKGV